MGRQRKSCPLCGKENLLHLYAHLRDVHHMESDERKKWLERSHSVKCIGPPKEEEEEGNQKQTKDENFSQDNKPWWETQSLLPFKPRSSMLITGQSNSGKTVFVNKLLQNLDGMYEVKPEAIMFCYSVWQPLYDDMEQNIPFI